MNAISPVIATLILIAIAVIAGVFVLRQFLIYSSTTPTQNMLQVQDATFIKTVTADGKWMNVTFTFNVKNIGTKQIQLTRIFVVDENQNYTIGVTLNPGQTWTGSFKLKTVTHYDAAWDSGTEHTVIFYYTVLGQPGEQSVAVKATVE